MFYRWQDGTLFLNCSIQPESREERFVGELGNAIKIRLTAAPSDGKANKQLVRFLAAQFQVKRSAVTIVSGHGSRKKVLSIEQPGTIPDGLMIRQE